MEMAFSRVSKAPVSQRHEEQRFTPKYVQEQYTQSSTGVIHYILCTEPVPTMPWYHSQ
mgnify:CR=1 FL=1